MKNFLVSKVGRFLSNEDGPTTVEYAVMLMLIVFVVIGTVQLIGIQLGESFHSSNGELEKAFGTSKDVRTK